MNEQSDIIQKSIFKDMSEGLIVIGLDGTIQYFNQAASDILVKSPEDLSTKKFSGLFINDYRNDLFFQTVLDAIRDLSGPHYNLVPYYAGDITKTIYVMTSFLKDGDQKIALIIILNDMTSMAEMKKRYNDKMIALIDSLIKALSVAIDERSRYSGNHTRNMIKIGKKFLEWLDRSGSSWKFDSLKKRVFLMSVWLHDVGKLSVPLEVMDKATKLGERMDAVEERFRRIHLLDRIAMLEGSITGEEYELREKNRERWISTVRRINTSSYLSEEDMACIQEMSAQKYTEEDNTETPVFTQDELTCLSIKKGTLTDAERSIMQSHVLLTQKILEKIDFPDDYLVVREWAGSHHELLNGKGYPDHKQGDMIAKEIRLLTILDIYEALTAKDRPYKKPMPAEKAFKILYSMADEGSIDREILDLFEKSGAWREIL